MITSDSAATCWFIHWKSQLKLQLFSSSRGTIPDRKLFAVVDMNVEGECAILEGARGKNCSRIQALWQDEFLLDRSRCNSSLSCLSTCGWLTKWSWSNIQARRDGGLCLCRLFSTTTSLNKFAEAGRHLPKLIKGRPFTVALNTGVAFVACYGFNLTIFNITGWQHCDRGSSKGMVCQVGRNTGSGRHRLEHVFQWVVTELS